MPIIDNKILAQVQVIQNLSRKPTPSETLTDQQLKAKFDEAAEAQRVKFNALIDGIIADYATKSELQGVVLNEIPDGTVTDAKLSNAAGQIKSEILLRAKKATNEATATADQVFSANGDGTFTFKNLIPNTRIASGTYVGDNANSRIISVGFTPKFVIVTSETTTNKKQWISNSQTCNMSYDDANEIIYATTTGNDGLLLTTDGFKLAANAGYYNNRSSNNYSYTAIG